MGVIIDKLRVYIISLAPHVVTGKLPTATGSTCVCIQRENKHLFTSHKTEVLSFAVIGPTPIMSLPEISHRKRVWNYAQ